MYLDVWLLGPSVQASSSYQTCPCAESLLHVCWFSGRAVLSLPIWSAVASIRCASIVQRSSPRRSISPIRISPIRRSACKSRTSPRRSILSSPRCAVYSPRLFGVDPVRVDRTKAEVAASIDIVQCTLLAYSACKARVDRYRLFKPKRTIVAAFLAYVSKNDRGVDPRPRVVQR